MAASFCRKSFINFKKSFNYSQCRSVGYLVLIPETPKDQPHENALLRKETLPEFKSLTTDQCEAAMGKYAQDYETGLWALENKLKDSDPELVEVFPDVIEPLEMLGVPLENTWGIIKTLYLADQNIMPTNKYMNIHERGRRVRSAKFTNEPIFKICNQALKVGNLTGEKERVVKKFVLEGSLNGLDLPKTKQTELITTLNHLGTSRNVFKGKLDASIKHFKQTVIDKTLMREFPVDYLRQVAVDPNQPTRGPWVITLQPHILKPFLEFCPDRKLRWNLWNADLLKCSAHNDQSVDTSIDLAEIRDFRHRQAQLLGYKTYVDMSMETKMAGNVENVQNMLSVLLEKAKVAQEFEVNGLEEYAIKHGFEGQLELWDVPYWKRKQQKSLFNFDEELLKDYFPLSQVLLGLFTLCEQLFSIKIEEREGAETWNPDVRFFRVIDEKTKKHIGGFYLDPYVRKGKVRVSQEAGWMVSLRNKSTIARSEPLVALIFNFPEPLYGKPSLLTFKDVELLFKRFGHTLQHILTTTTYSEVAGLSNIEWDAVEVCSNFLTQWLYDRNTLESISSHYETEEPLSPIILDNLTKLRQHMVGLDLCKEIYLSNLDLQLHLTKEFWLNIVRKIWPEHFLFKLEKNDSHPCSFREIVSDEWGAAYYCHIWSRMVAADVFSAFTEAGLQNQQEIAVIGNRFRETFLSLGGSCPPGEVFRRFRGRDPSPNALLYDLGLKDIVEPEPEPVPTAQ